MWELKLRHVERALARLGPKAGAGSVLLLLLSVNTACQMISNSPAPSTAPPAAQSTAPRQLRTSLAPAGQQDGWGTIVPEAAGLSSASLSEMEREIEAGQLRKISSVLIARHGKLAYEAYFDGTDATALRDTRSVTKTVTSMLVGIAIDRGLLAGVAEPVVKFFPDRKPFANPHPRKERITIEDFLTMSSPLDCDDNNENSPGNEERMYETRDWVRFALDIPLRTQSGRGRANRPSARVFSYCTAGVTTLGGVIERVTSTTVPEFAKQNLFDPLGINRVEWQYSPAGQAQTGGGLRLTSRDLLKLGQLYADGGRWGPKPVVSAAWVSRSVRAHVRVKDSTHYGYLWWVREYEAKGKKFSVFYMAGNGGNKVAVVPALNMVVVITSTNFNTQGMHEQTDRLLTDYVLAPASR
jgi:CubicO group peptidase (beta-lactamase class C family)